MIVIESRMQWNSSKHFVKLSRLVPVGFGWSASTCTRYFIRFRTRFTRQRFEIEIKRCYENWTEKSFHPSVIVAIGFATTFPSKICVTVKIIEILRLFEVQNYNLFQNLMIRDLPTMNNVNGEKHHLTFAQLKPRLMSLLINALRVETDPQNTHMLLGFTDYLKYFVLRRKVTFKWNWNLLPNFFVSNIFEHFRWITVKRSRFSDRWRVGTSNTTRRDLERRTQLLLFW